MTVNFRTHKINQNIHKLIQILILKKNSRTHELGDFLERRLNSWDGAWKWNYVAWEK